MKGSSLKRPNGDGMDKGAAIGRGISHRKPTCEWPDI